jgi:hypothetical protein
MQNSDHKDVAISRLCEEFEQTLKNLRAGTQSNAKTLEEGIRKLTDAKESFDLKVANAVGYPTNSESSKHNLFYKKLKKRAPERWQEMRDLRTEAESLQKELAKQLTQRRLVELLVRVCSDFREQLRDLRDAAQAGTLEDPLSQLENAKQSFEVQVANAVGYSTGSASWKSFVFYTKLRERAPERWEEVRDLRTEAKSLLNSFKKDVEFICAKFSYALNSIPRQLHGSAESLETYQTELEITTENFTRALSGAIDQEITDAVWQDIGQFRALLLKRIPEQVEKILALREQTLATERELAKAESQLLAATFLPLASQPLRDRARVGACVRTEKTFFVEAKQLRPLPGEPNYRVLPADVWMQIAKAAAATVWIEASDDQPTK